ncbi:MAG TPA: hypothetical protein V6D00_07640 [Pantanalinema sp.]
MTTSREFDWGTFDARIRKLEALADEVRAYVRARTFPEVSRASARLHAALEALDRTEAPGPARAGAMPPKESAPESVMVADLLRRKRVYEALLRTGQKVADIGDGAS